MSSYFHFLGIMYLFFVYIVDIEKKKKKCRPRIGPCGTLVLTGNNTEI